MKTYTYEPTRHKDLSRLVDREGNWHTYFHKPSGKYLTGVTTILERGYTKGRGFEEWLLNQTRESRDKILKETGDRGDMVHRAIECILTFGSKSKKQEMLKLDRAIGIFNPENNDYIQLKDDEWDCILAFSEFIKRHNFVVYASEGSVFNLEQGYAGTLDFIGVITKACGVKSCACEDIVGHLGLWDAKTSSGIRASFSAQEAAYAKADNISEYTHGKPIQYIGTLRLGTNHKTTGGYQVEVRLGINGIETSYKRFLAAKTIADEEYGPFDPEKDIKDIPDQIALTIEHYQAPKPKKARKPRKAKEVTK